MTGLLVSVRNAGEAQVALVGGADIVDVKEPRSGSLGAAPVATWQEVAEVVSTQALLSIALGELTDFDPVLGNGLPGNTHFAKIGLAGCADRSDWPVRWQEAWESLPRDVQRVAVCYVDHQQARSPGWELILQRAPAAGCKCLLLDTFDKSAGDLFTHWSVAHLRHVVARATDLGLLVVAAGSIGEADLERLEEAGVGYLAVRGAVCRPDRSGHLQEGLVRRLRAACGVAGASISTG